MYNKEVRSKLAEMIESFDEIIKGTSRQNRKLKELIKWRNELKELITKIDNGWSIDWEKIIPIMLKVIDFLYSFNSDKI